MRRREELNSAGANFLQKLRESEFLNAIKHRSAIPGGTCEFDLPDYLPLALTLDPDTRERRPRGDWLATIRPLCDVGRRSSCGSRARTRGRRQETAVGGNFQIIFERDRPVQLLRITLPARHGPVPRGERQPPSLLAALPALEQRSTAAPVQATEDVSFVLATCI